MPDAAPDWILNGQAAGDRFGWRAGPAGDVNGDGFDDVIVSARYHDGVGVDAGRAYVFEGGTHPDAVPDLILSGEAANDEFGISVASAGDVDGDGFDDVLVGAWANDAGGDLAGRAYLYRGGATPDADADAIFTGDTANDWLGMSVAGAGDLDGDGRDDIVIGIPHHDGAGADAGQVVVYAAAGAKTPTGSDVAVEPTDPKTGEKPVKVTYDSVTKSGTTSVSTKTSGPSPPVGYKNGTTPKYYDVKTSAQVAGKITLRIKYEAENFTKEENIRAFHKENDIWVDRTETVEPATKEIAVAVSSLSLFALFEAEPGAIAGHVVADCPEPGTTLLGVEVDAFTIGSGDLVASTATESDGSYFFGDINFGDYTISLVTPLGYTTESDEAVVSMTPDQTVTVDYSVNCVDIYATPRSIGFWKHQVGVATGGRGNAQIDAGSLCDYLDLIEVHFNSNAVNQVAVYVPPASDDCQAKLEVAKELLNLRGNAGMTARAKQQLLALLMNVAKQFISLTEVISEDGATVSQAITYCDNLIDASAGDHELAKDIAATINGGRVVAAGLIPLDTSNIAYARRRASAPLRISPNPGGSEGYTLSFGTSSEGPVELVIYNVAGQRVATLISDVIGAGYREIRWAGRTASGRPLGNGVYFAQLTSANQTKTAKFIHVGR